MQNIRQYIWGLLGRFSPSLVFLGTTIILARLLTPDDFGVIGVLTIVITVSEALTDAGLGGSLVKEKELTNKDCCTIFNFNLIVSFSLYSILFLCADLIEDYFDIEKLAVVTRLLSLTFVINAFSLVPKALMMRSLQFRELFVISIVASLISAIASIISAYLNAGLYSLVIYRLLSPLLGSILSFYYSNFKYHLLFSKKSFRKLIPFGLYTSLSTVVDTLYENFLTTIFGKVMGVTTTGYFYQAKKTEEAATTSISNTIGYVAFPVLTRVKDDKMSFVTETTSIMNTIVGIIIPFVLLASVYSEEIMQLLYGTQWLDSAYFFRLLMYAGCFMILESLNRSFIKALGEGKMIFVVSLTKRISGIIILILCAIGVPDLMVFAYILCSFIAFLINQFALSRCLCMNFVDGLVSICKLLLPSIIMFGLFLVISTSMPNWIIGLIINLTIIVVYYLFYLPRLGVFAIKNGVKSLLHLFDKKNV